MLGRAAYQYVPIDARGKCASRSSSQLGMLGVEHCRFLPGVRSCSGFVPHKIIHLPSSKATLRASNSISHFLQQNIFLSVSRFWKRQPPTPHTPLPRASAQLCNGSGEFGGVCMSGLVSIRRLYCSTGRLVEATLQTCIVLTSPLLGSVRVQTSLCLFLSLPVRPGSRLLCPIDTMH